MLLSILSFGLLRFALQFPEVFFVFFPKLPLLPFFLPAALPVYVGNGGVGGGVSVTVPHGSFLLRPVVGG